MEEDPPARKRRRLTPTAPGQKPTKRKPRVSPLQALKRRLREQEKDLKKQIRELSKKLTVVTRDRKRTSRCR